MIQTINYIHSCLYLQNYATKLVLNVFYKIIAGNSKGNKFLKFWILRKLKKGKVGGA